MKKVYIEKARGNSRNLFKLDTGIVHICICYILKIRRISNGRRIFVARTMRGMKFYFFFFFLFSPQYIWHIYIYVREKFEMASFYIAIAAIKSRKSGLNSKFRKFIRASTILKCTSIVTSSKMHIYEIHFRRKLRMQLLRFEEPVAIKFHRAVHLLDSLLHCTRLFPLPCARACLKKLPAA